MDFRNTTSYANKYQGSIYTVCRLFAYKMLHSCKEEKVTHKNL